MKKITLWSLLGILAMVHTASAQETMSRRKLTINPGFIMTPQVAWLSKEPKKISHDFIELHVAVSLKKDRRILTPFYDFTNQRYGLELEYEAKVSPYFVLHKDVKSINAYTGFGVNYRLPESQRWAAFFLEVGKNFTESQSGIALYTGLHLNFFKK
jgi:hypothetical protein